jgi:hypothetical protein
VEVCDLPYCSDPDLFYWHRMKARLSVKELRKYACCLFRKENDPLTVRHLKLAFLRIYPIEVNLGGDDHEVSIKKLKGCWTLSCNCKSWIFNLSDERRCKHTEYIENLMQKEEERWGVYTNGR